MDEITRMGPMYDIEYGCVNIRGGVRNKNQDNFYVDGHFRPENNPLTDLAFFGTLHAEDNALAAVYDGMGGEACGETASLLAAQGTAGFDRRPGQGEQTLYALCVSLNGAVCAFMEERRITRMGSTAAVLRFEADGVVACNLGDSRIYRIADGAAAQLSLDHAAKTVGMPYKPPLVQYLGLPTDEVALQPYIVRQPYTGGEYYLLCSDGVTDMLSDAEIALTVSAADDVRDGVMELVSQALKKGGYDNITAILCKVNRRSESYVL